jgi:hypothetical protein
VGRGTSNNYDDHLTRFLAELARLEPRAASMAPSTNAPAVRMKFCTALHAGWRAFSLPGLLFALVAWPIYRANHKPEAITSITLRLSPPPLDRWRPIRPTLNAQSSTLDLVLNVEPQQVRVQWGNAYRVSQGNDPSILAQNIAALLTAILDDSVALVRFVLFEETGGMGGPHRPVTRDYFFDLVTHKPRDNHDQDLLCHANEAYIHTWTGLINTRIFAPRYGQSTDVPQYKPPFIMPSLEELVESTSRSFPDHSREHMLEFISHFADESTLKQFWRSHAAPSVPAQFASIWLAQHNRTDPQFISQLTKSEAHELAEFSQALRDAGGGRFPGSDDVDRALTSAHWQHVMGAAKRTVGAFLWC